MACICNNGALVRQKKELIKQWLGIKIALLAFTAIYFYVVLAHVMPALAGDEQSYQLSRYDALGDSLGEIIVNMISNPIEVIELLFKNPKDNSIYDNLKIQSHVMVLASGGIALLIRPQYLFMLIPIYLQKMLYSSPAMWGIGDQYSIEFAPILALAPISFNHKVLSQNRYRYICYSFMVIAPFLATNATLNNREEVWYVKAHGNPFYIGHYQTELDISDMYSILE